MYTWETQQLGYVPNRLASDLTVAYVPGFSPPFRLVDARVRDAKWVRFGGLAAQNMP